jgi:hypothetical protein
MCGSMNERPAPRTSGGGRGVARNTSRTAKTAGESHGDPGGQLALPAHLARLRVPADRRLNSRRHRAKTVV